VASNRIFISYGWAFGTPVRTIGVYARRPAP
jgi:hypothetical protein